MRTNRSSKPSSRTRGTARLEARAPLGERLRVARAEGTRLADAQARRLGGRAEALGARQHAAGEDVALDEVGLAAVVVEAGLVDGDRLQRGNAARGQQVAHPPEEHRPPALADRLEHLDRRDRRVRLGHRAVVLQPDVDPVLEPGLRDRAASPTRAAPRRA